MRNILLNLSLIVSILAVSMQALADEQIKGVNPPPPRNAKAKPKRTKTLPKLKLNYSKQLYLNVLDYGVIGDGKHDDTQAFQKAISAAVALGRVLWIPNKSYKITSTLKCRGLRGIQGEAYLGSTLLYSGKGFCLDLRGMLYAQICTISIKVKSKDEKGNWIASGILVGNGSSQNTPASGEGNDGTSDAERSAGLVFQNVFISGGKIGIKIDGGCWINYYYRLRVQGCDTGIYLGTAANSNDFFSPIILSNKVGVHIAGSLYGVHFFGGLNEENKEKGFLISGKLEKFNILVSGMYFENHCVDFYIDGQVRNLTVCDGYFAGYWKNKKPVIIHTNRYPYSGIVFRDNMIYLTHQPVYADLNGATITVDNCYALKRHIKNGTIMVPKYSKRKCK